MTGTAPIRGVRAIVLVAAVASAFGVILLAATHFLAGALSASAAYGESRTLTFVVSLLSVLLVGVAIYISGVVTANTLATAVAGNTRQIALLRLIGASAGSERRRFTRSGARLGALGAGMGAVIGAGAALVATPVAARMLELAVTPQVLDPTLLIPPAVVALTTWGASWSGSRRVLGVRPVEALGQTVDTSYAEVAARRVRNAIALGLLGIGGVLLVIGIVVGFVTPLGVIVAFLGGIVSFTGLAVGASLLLPPVLTWTGRLLGSSPVARLAAENALRHPDRSSRMTIGVVMGVTLVTMFAVAVESTKALVAASGGGEPPADFIALLDAFALVMMGLVAVSAVIAGVGMVNLLHLGALQRRREFGLLRALGFSAAQVRRVVLLEAVHITATALAVGLVLGTVYGWAGAQSLLGSVRVPPLWLSPTFVLPVAPALPILAVVAGTALLTVAATVIPTRLATRVTPLAALADA